MKTTGSKSLSVGAFALFFISGIIMLFPRFMWELNAIGLMSMWSEDLFYVTYLADHTISLVLIAIVIIFATAGIILELRNKSNWVNPLLGIYGVFIAFFLTDIIIYLCRVVLFARALSFFALIYRVGSMLMVITYVIAIAMAIFSKKNPTNKLIKLGFVAPVICLLATAILFLVDLRDIYPMFGYGWFQWVPYVLDMIAMLGCAVSVTISVLAISAKAGKVENKEPDISSKNKAKVVTRAQVSPVRNSVPEELRKYKQLYDDGVITEEEFVQKKKQLMGL